MFTVTNTYIMHYQTSLLKVNERGIVLEEILRVYVELEDSIQVKGQTCNVNMIRFSGYAKSKYFQGKILPG